MNAETIISAAWPDAKKETIEHILWARTPFPFKLTPRILYHAASRLRRACANGRTLCDHCDNEAEPGKMECYKCRNALASTK